MNFAHLCAPASALTQYFALRYLDIIAATRARVEVPVACYHVSGEYAMLWHAAAAGSFDLKTAGMASLYLFLCAAADCLCILVHWYLPVSDCISRSSGGSNWL